MSVINSPLGALGALMVLLQGLAVGAIAALGGQPDLQGVLTLAIVTVSVLGLVWYVLVRLKRPELLFDPRSFAESVQQGIYLGKQAEPPPEAPVDLVTVKPGPDAPR